MRKAVFLGVAVIHSNKQDKDYRKVDLYTPPFKDANGYTRGGVESIFTPLDSTLGNNIELGAIVLPEYEHNHYSGREELTSLEVVQKSPYVPEDFD